MASGSSHIQDEMREVEEELEEDSAVHDSHNARGTTILLESVEAGTGTRSPRVSTSRLDRSASPRPSRSGPSIHFPLSGGNNVGPLEKGKHWTMVLKEKIRTTLQMTTNPVFAQAFVLTFLGEWGDRSQITTIAMAGAHVRACICLEFSIEKADEMLTECGRHCFWDNRGSRCMYLRCCLGWTISLHKNLC